MRILSLNVNDFGGLTTLQELKYNYGIHEAYLIWKEIDKTNVSNVIFKYIKDINPDIAILQEFELYAKESKDFISNMDILGFSVVPYGRISLKNPSITIMFIKKDLEYICLPNPHRIKTQKTLRANIIKCKGCIIYGTHVPYDLDYWDELITNYNQYRRNPDEKIVIIGDLNTYKDGTPYKKKFDQLVHGDNALDAWIERGNPNDTVTYGMSRIDYALMSPAIYRLLRNLQIDPSLMQKGITDHAAQIIDFII